MAVTIYQALSQGVAAHKEGKLEEAEILYRLILKKQPKHPDANHNLGILVSGIDRAKEGLKHLKVALRSNPKQSQFWLSYMDALIKHGQLDQAVQLIKDGKKAKLKVEMIDQLEIRLMSAADPTPKRPSNKQIDDLIALYSKGRAEDALSQGNRLETQFPNDLNLLNILGAIYTELGRYEAAVIRYNKAIKYKPGYATLYNNLGNSLYELGLYKEALCAYNRAIQLKPDYSEAYYNKGNILFEPNSHKKSINGFEKASKFSAKSIGADILFEDPVQTSLKYNEAIISYKRASIIKSDLAESHYNSGRILQICGQYEEATTAYNKAIDLKENFFEAHHNLSLNLQEIGQLGEASEHCRILLNKLSLNKTSTFRPPITALVVCGRPGSLFFHSLIDGHPEIATVPGVYLKSWFGLNFWKHFEPDFNKDDWREDLVDTFIREYEPLFDANCTKNVRGKPFGETEWLSKTQGFMEMGFDASQPLILDTSIFSAQLLTNLRPLEYIGSRDFFELIHRTFDMAIRGRYGVSTKNNGPIFYHLHNPTLIERHHFLEHYPQAQFLVITRNPMQSLESLIMSHLQQNSFNHAPLSNQSANQIYWLHVWRSLVTTIITLFSQIRAFYNDQGCTRGIRLEDIKRNPKVIMPKIADWIGVSDHPSLYNSSFCGMQYWGPFSRSTGKITGFDTKSIDQAVGKLLKPSDIKIFETLFWPYSNLYGYTEVNDKSFRTQLSHIRPLLSKPLDFERQIFTNLTHNNHSIEEFADYKRLHRFMSQLWTILDKEGTYKGMPFPLLA